MDIPSSKSDTIINPGDNKNKDILNTLTAMKITLPHKHYIQVTPIGCWIATFLMWLSWLNNEYEPNQNDEIYWTKNLRKISGAVPTFELMRLVDKYNLKMDIYFENSTSDFDENSSLIRNYNKTVHYMKNKWVIWKNIESTTIDIELIKKHISQWRYVMLNGMVSWIPHMRLCIWYNENNELLIADPLLSNIQKYSELDFKKNCSPPFWKRFISLYK